MTKFAGYSAKYWHLNRAKILRPLFCLLVIALIYNQAPPVFANTPSAGGNATVVSPVDESAVSISEDAPQPEAANIRLVIPVLSDPGGSTPNSIRIISVTGGSLQTGAGGTIVQGASGTILALDSGRADFRFAPTANRDTAATFQYVVVDPHDSSVNSSESTATINITAVNDPPTLQTSSGENGDGLYGIYYLNDWQLSGSTTNRIDPIIDFNSSASSPNPTTVWGIADINPEQYSVRWTGKVKAPVSGSYYFRTYTDDGVRLWVNDNLVVDQWIPQAATYWTSSEISLVANTKYNIKMEYYERGGGETAQLLWSYPGQSYQVIPQAYLFPGTSRATLSYVSESGATVIDDGAMILDIDSANISSAAISISSNYISGEDYLGFNNQNGITGSFDGTTGTLTLSGSSSLANYQTALQSVTYTNTNSDPSTSTRTITFMVNDGSSNSNSTTRSIAITTVNNPPVITQGASTSVTMDEDSSPAAFNLTLGATDLENNTLTWSVSGSAGHGSASISGTGNSKVVSYTPAANYNGTDTFLVQVSDGLGGADTITINVTISPRNDAPANTVAPSISGTLHPGQTLTANTGTWNDGTDLTPGTISYTYQWRRYNDQLGNGLSIVGTNSTYNIATADLNKYLVLRVTATDNGEGLPAAQSASADTAYFQITNTAPVIAEGASLSKTIDEDSAPTAFSQNLTASDADGDTLFWSISTPAAHGSAVLSGSSNTRAVTYEPAANYNGTDSFVITVSDSCGGSAATAINVTINPRNDAPQITAFPSLSRLVEIIRVDHTLGVSSGTWNDDNDLVPGTITFGYQWQRCETVQCPNPVNIVNASNPTYTVRPEDQSKFIRVQITASDNGEGVPSNQSVVVYTEPVGQILAADTSLSIEKNKTYTNSNIVGLGLLVQNILTGVTEMSFSEDPLFTSAVWIPFSLTATYQLSSGDGQKTVYVRFRDSANNQSASYSNIIILDTVAELAVEKIDKQTVKSAFNQVITNSTKPTITGIAEPNSFITITIHSDPITGTTTADGNGKWSWIPPLALPFGTHQAIIQTTDLAGNSKEINFNILVKRAEAADLSIASTNTDQAIDSQTQNPNSVSSPEPENVQNTTAESTGSTSERATKNYWLYSIILLSITLITFRVLERRKKAAAH